MRTAVPVAILVSTAFLLAGCGDKGDEELHYVCSDGVEIHQDDHPSANTTVDLAKFCAKTKTNTTSQAPNVLPKLTLMVMDDGGNMTNVTMLDGNLTFSAVGSTDPDGTIAGIAVTVTDSNTTRTASLYDTGKKQFKDATFKFDRPGIVNVTVAMVDDRAGFTVNQTKVYVNHEQAIPSQTIQSAAPAGMDPCYGADDDPSGTVTGDLYESSFFKTYSFALFPGATYVEALSDQSNAQLTICKPIPGATGAHTHDPVSPTAASPVVSDQELPVPVGTDSYHVGVTVSFPSTGPTDVAVTVIVHYEPKPAA